MGALSRGTWTIPVVWISGQEVFGTKASPGDVREVLTRVPRLAATLIITKLLGHLDPLRIPEWLQIERAALRPYLLRPAVRARVESLDPYDPARPRTAFHRQQLLVALCLAQHWCFEQEKPDTSPETNFMLGEALLRISDLLSPGDVLKSESPGDVGALLLPYFYESNPTDPRFALLRTSRLLKQNTWLTNPTLKSFQARFESETGLSLEEYLHVLVVLYARLETMHLVTNWQSVTRWQAFTAGPLTGTVHRALQDLAVAYSDLPRLVSPPEVVIADRTFEPFRSRGLITLPKDGFLFSDYVLCAQQTTSGLLWRLRRLATSKAEGEALIRAWGTLMENHLHQVLGPVLGEAYIPSPRDSQGNEITDALVNYGEQVVVVESKAAILRHDMKYAKDSSLLEQELMRKFVKDGQLGRALTRLFGQERLGQRFLAAMRGTGARGVRLVYPLLITDDYSLTTPGVARFIGDLVSESLRTASLPKRPRIERLTVAAVQDVEMLVSVLARGVKLKNFLRDRLRRDPQGDNTLHNYLYDIASETGLDLQPDKAAAEQLMSDARAFWMRMTS